VSQKTIHLTFGYNFVHRYSKFFHWQIPKETVGVIITGSSTSP